MKTLTAVSGILTLCSLGLLAAETFGFVVLTDDATGIIAKVAIGAAVFFIVGGVLWYGRSLARSPFGP